MGYAFEHLYLLSTAHSPPPCSFFGKNSLLTFTPIFRFKMLLCSMNPTLVSPNTHIKNQYCYPRISPLKAALLARPLPIIYLSGCPWYLVEHKHFYWFSDELLAKSQLHWFAITLSVLLRLSNDPKPAEKVFNFSQLSIYIIYEF